MSAAHADGDGDGEGAEGSILLSGANNGTPSFSNPSPSSIRLNGGLDDVTGVVEGSPCVISSALTAAIAVAVLPATPMGAEEEEEEEEEVEEEEEEEEEVEEEEDEEDGGGIEKAVEAEVLQIMLKSKSTVMDRETFLACTSISARLMGNIPRASISYSNNITHPCVVRNEGVTYEEESVYVPL